MNLNKTIYSHHHFMFPFRWDILPKGFKKADIKENEPFDDRTNLQDIIFNDFNNWQRKQFNLKNEDGTINPLNYSEFTYFHEFVAKAIFDYEYPWKKNQHIIKYFEYDIDKSKKNTFQITHLVQTNKNDYNNYHEEFLELDVDGITIHFFNTGVGVLTYNLSNTLVAQNSKEKILLINEYGRRMYPQYMGHIGIENALRSFLAKKIKLTINDAVLAIEDHDFYTTNSELSVVEPYQLPDYVRHIFPEQFIFRMEDYPLNQKQILITKVTDDRMFFHSWYGDEDVSEDMKYTYTSSDWWYAYIFGDKDYNSITIQNDTMKKKHINKHTYQRWADWGTLYGMSRDSFVCVCNDNMAPFIRNHMNTMYYSISVLCLAQRTSILKFTAEVANLSDLAKLEDDKKLINNIKGVYKNYIEFINKLYFREITPQIQGIEMYNQFQEILNLENEIKDLDNEISELHDYVNLVQQGVQNDNAETLNKMATFFLPFSVVFGILGANFLIQKPDTDQVEMLKIFGYNGFWVGIGASMVLIVLIFLFSHFIKKWKK